MSGKIILPLDGSRSAERALPHAGALARLTLWPVVPVRGVEGAMLSTLEPAHAEQDRVLDAQRYLDDITYELSTHDVPNERGIAELIPPGLDAADWIVGQAATRDAELVVMGTHGRSGLSRWVYGSTTEKVLARTPVPLLLVEAQETESPPPAPRQGGRVLVPLDGSGLSEEALLPALMLARVLRGGHTTAACSAADGACTEPTSRGCGVSIRVAAGVQAEDAAVPGGGRSRARF